MLKTDKSFRCRYVRIDGYYFPLQQNIAFFAWMLFFRKNVLITIQPWLKENIPLWKKLCSRYYLYIIKHNLINIVLFVQCRLGLRNLETVQLPVYGHFGIHVHQGYKIFNLYNNTVTKIFDADVSRSSIMQEIERLKKVSQISFAPSLRKWDIDERWYQEDYICSNIPTAHRSPDSDIFLKAFYREAMPCLNSLILFQPHQTRYLSRYLREIIEILEKSEFSRVKLVLEEAVMFNKFVHTTVERLNAVMDCPVHLVFSHGDFSPVNFLNSKDGLKIVDWESAGFRSLLFDFYSYFFYRSVTRKFPASQMVSEINEALPYFISQLSLMSSDITDNLLASVGTYRHLYYIERLCMLVERDLTDKYLSMKEYIFRYIKAFQVYEDILAAGVKG